MAWCHSVAAKEAGCRQIQLPALRVSDTDHDRVIVDIKSIRCLLSGEPNNVELQPAAARRGKSAGLRSALCCPAALGSDHVGEELDWLLIVRVGELPAPVTVAGTRYEQGRRYIAGRNDEPGNAGGDGFMRLHEWYFAAGEVADRMNATGAVLVGRRTAEQAEHYKGDHHGVPICVLSHRPPPPSAANYPLVTYVTDGIASAVAQAKAAAGDRDVLVHGANAAQQALEAGVLDEIQNHQIPVLLGAGRRLLDSLPSRIELEIVQVIDTPHATHIRYRIRR